MAALQWDSASIGVPSEVRKLVGRSSGPVSGFMRCQLRAKWVIITAFFPRATEATGGEGLDGVGGRQGETYRKGFEDTDAD